MKKALLEKGEGMFKEQCWGKNVYKGGMHVRKREEPENTTTQGKTSTSKGKHGRWGKVEDSPKKLLIS